jgi:hypothetical protein
MSFGLRNEAHGGGASCYDSYIVTPHPELLRPISVYDIDVVEPRMTISYPMRHPEHDPMGGVGGHEHRSWLRHDYEGGKETVGIQSM